MALTDLKTLVSGDYISNLENVAKAPSGFVNSLLLAAAAESMTVPAGARFCRINTNGVVSVEVGETPTATAAADVTDGTGSFLVNGPTWLDVTDVAAISVFPISTTPAVSFEFWS